MSLSTLIRKRDHKCVATAIPATSATEGHKQPETVARIATVAVAKYANDQAKPDDSPTSGPVTKTAIPADPPPLVVPDVAAALGRSVAYLMEPDDRLPGLCLLAGDDIEDIQAGRLPIEAARLYLSNMERDHPHLVERREPARLAARSGAGTATERTPIETAIEGLTLAGLEIVPEDARYIRHRLGCRMDWAGRLDAYRLVWLEAMQGQLPHQKQNRGRFAANTWLREVME